MIPLLNTHANNVAEKAKELGYSEFGQLIVPAASYFPHPDYRFAIDNGAYSGFRRDSFVALLERSEPDRGRCIFVAAPDVVGSARRTLEVFDHWQPRLAHWPVALVAQDGIEGLEIPWSKISAVFIGGTNKFKNSPECEHVIGAAKILGKWVHVGRVNSPDRWERFEDLGADSCDGTGILKYSHMRRAIAERNTEGRLFDGKIETQMRD